MAGDCLDRLITKRARNSAAKRAANERKRKGDTVVENLKEAKRLSSGVLARHGIHSLNDPRFLEAYNDKRKKVIEKADQAANAKRERVQKKIQGVMALRAKYGDEKTHQFANFTLTECGTYLQYKKTSSKDPGMPKDLIERRSRCLEWMHRPSPTASPNGSDDEGESEDDGEGEEEEPNDMDGVVAGLLGLASGPSIDVGLEASM